MMSGKTVFFQHLVKLLQNTGYIQSCGKDIPPIYTSGPAGTLLRHNILKTWWDRMVTKSEATFPVSGHNIDSLNFFAETFELVNKSLPFSIAHVSLESRSTPIVSTELQHLLNYSIYNLSSKEETVLKFSHFCQQAMLNQVLDQIVNTRMKWWKADFVQKTIGEGSDTSVLHIQYQFPWGPETIETICNKGQKDLCELEIRTGVDCKYSNGKKSLYPYHIVCLASLEMAMAVFLTDAFTEELDHNKPNSFRQILHLHPMLAPYKAAITTDGNKQKQIHGVATYISRELRNKGLQILDTKDTKKHLQEQLLCYDQLGIPFTIIVTDETIDNGAITVRQRNTRISDLLPINELNEYIAMNVN